MSVAPPPKVQTGLERIFADKTLRARLDGRRIAWLANATTVDDRLCHGIDRSLADGLRIERIFGPEHGLRGVAQDMIGVDTHADPITGLPTLSLYGHDADSLRPEPEHLDGLDVVLIDMQDIGTRYYTYAATAALMVDACHRAGVEAWVLDRPNPIGGEAIEGNVVGEAFRSFVGMYALATRHAMTLGELCRLLARRHGWEDVLTVVEMQGWRRDMWFDDTGLPWVMPSPNMPTLDTATVYPGQCLIEGTTMSEGRGTTRPFELFGAPWLDADGLREELEAAALPGVAWRSVAFEPTFQKHARETCLGLQLHVTDRRRYDSLSTSLVLLQTIARLHRDDFRWRTEVYEFVSDRLAIDLLLGDQVLRLGLEDQLPIAELEAAMAASRAGFEAERREVLLYT